MTENRRTENKKAANKSEKRKVSLKVSCPRPPIGTLAWLFERAFVVRIGERERTSETGTRREAVLCDKSGRVIVCLGWVGVIPGERGGPARIEKRTLSQQIEVEGIPWTEGAWSLLHRLSKEVSDLMAEPVWMADRIEVRLRPIDHLEGQFLRSSGSDALARQAWADRREEAGERSGRQAAGESGVTEPTEPTTPADEDEIPF